MIAVLLSGFACSGSSIHKANQAAKQIADDLSAFEVQIEQQYAAGNLSKAEAINLETLCSQATLANDTFVQKVQTLSGLDSSNAPQVTAWLAELVTSIDALNQQGVLQIKNPSAQQKFNLYAQSLATGLTILEGVLQVYTQPAAKVSAQ
jgi:hypothetical protein